MLKFLEILKQQIILLGWQRILCRLSVRKMNSTIKEELKTNLSWLAIVKLMFNGSLFWFPEYHLPN